MPDDLNEDRRKHIFVAVVEAQDRGLSVPDARRLVADETGATPEQVRDIELEGVRKGWPPLGD
jgi:hypothetical protein